jgi:hypothetical protein
LPGTEAAAARTVPMSIGSRRMRQARLVKGVEMFNHYGYFPADFLQDVATIRAPLYFWL